MTKADNADSLNLATSWVGLTLPGTQDRAVFNQTVTGDLTTPLGVDSAWSGILLTGTTNNWAISSPNQLALGASGISVATASGNLALAAPLRVALTSAQTWSVASNRAVAVSATVAGSAGAALTKAGEGTLTLAGDNSALSGTNILGNGTANQSGTGAASFGSGGFVLVSNNTSLGLGFISAKGAQLQAAADGLVIPNKISIDLGALRFSGSHDFQLSGTVTNSAGTRGIGNYSGSRTLTLSGTLATFPGYNVTFQANDGAVSNGTVVVAGAVTGGGNLLVDTSFDYGTVVFAGNNSYTGLTSVSSGTLRLDYTSQNNSKLSDTAAFSLANATLELVGGSHLERISATTFSGATYLGNGTANSAGPTSQTATASSGGFVVLGHNNALGSDTAYSLGLQFRARVPGLVIPNPVVVSNGTTLVRGAISNDQNTGAPTVKSSYVNGKVIFEGATNDTVVDTDNKQVTVELLQTGTIIKFF